MEFTGCFRLSKAPVLHPPLRTQACEACGACKHDAALFLCDGCKVVWYCSNEHQQNHHITHEPLCSQIQECEKVLKTKDRELKDDLGISVFDEPDAIIGHLTRPMERPGHWDSPARKPVEKLTEDLIGVLMKVSTTEAHEVALRFSRSLYLIVPSATDRFVLTLMILLRLGRDQQCYDVLEWWRVNTVEDQGYIQGKLPIDTTDSDPFDVALNFPFKDFRTDIELFFIMQLLNIRRLVELHALQYTGDLLSTKRLPLEIINMIEGDGIGPLIRRSQRFRSVENVDVQSKGIDLIWRCIDDLHCWARYCCQGAPLVWAAFRYPGYWFPTRGSTKIPIEGGWRHEYIRSLWAETSIAFEVLAEMEYCVTGYPTLIQQMEDFWQYRSSEQFGNFWYGQRLWRGAEEKDG
ncbi:hypothetical protein GGR53DRAFT_526053 [Hypoxylon sp. FL1150]|nr:hypothetical protein GGR53DRAFT_526053 [Hypoxylon sp. FL1150]